MARERPGQSALVGLGSLILIPCAIVIAAITIIGIPLALVASALYVVLVYLSRVPIALWLGERVAGGSSRTGRSGALVNFLIGGLILLVVGFVPFVGGLVTAIAVILGLGTLLLGARAPRERQPV
jgi:threonine/homoserine efflux transporter RhtA